jgi:hypothetical protein
MTQLIYKTSKTHYYGIELNANFSRKSFAVKVPSMIFSKFENCKTVKLSADEFEEFYNFSGDQWMNIFFTPELRSKYLIFTEKVKRAKIK